MKLHDIACKYGTDKAQGHDYCRVYERYFEPLRHEPISLLEIGVQFGHSINTWLEYFDNAQIYGVDILNEFNCSNVRYHFTQGNQSDTAFWKSYLGASKNFRIVIDDACHRADASKISFECIWPSIDHGGLYIIEDVMTWWDDDFVSPHNKGALIAELGGILNWQGKSYHGKPHPKPFTLTPYETTIDFIHMYHGLVIIGKKA